MAEKKLGLSLEKLSELEPAWVKGDEKSVIETKSGSNYIVYPSGRLWGGGRGLMVKDALLHGSVFRGYAPLLTDRIVVGMSMEFSWEEKTYTSSPVVAVTPVKVN